MSIKENLSIRDDVDGELKSEMLSPEVLDQVVNKVKSIDKVLMDKDKIENISQLHKEMILTGDKLEFHARALAKGTK